MTSPVAEAARFENSCFSSGISVVLSQAGNMDHVHSSWPMAGELLLLLL